MTSLKPYPAYRKTDLPWLGQIPAHWEAKRLKFVASINPSKSEINNLPKSLEVSFLPMELVGEGTLMTDKIKTLEDVGQGFTYFRNGDVVVAKITPSFENGKGAIADGLVNGIGFGTTELHVIRPSNQLDKQFIYYLTISYDFRHNGAGLMQGTAGQQRVPDSFLINYPITYPSLSEQQKIATYLDDQTAKIDALIAKKERLLDLLAEQRAALISQAVTKGLNPNVKMKDSGVAWLGQVPSHWKVLHLRRVINKFVDYRGHTPPKVDDGIPLITARNIKNGKIDWELSQEYIPEELYEEWMIRGFPEIGDVLVTMEAPLGETAQITETHIALAQRIILLKADKTKIENDYLKYFLASTAGQGELWSRATGSTAIGIKASHLKEIIVLVPPIEEQIEITKVIRQEEKKILALIPKVETAIERLREYRAALISSAVTGKIQV